MVKSRRAFIDTFTLACLFILSDIVQRKYGAKDQNEELTAHGCPNAVKVPRKIFLSVDSRSENSADATKTGCQSC
jgi:hypothetical protein